MRRLCTEGSCSYSGRSVRRGGERVCVGSQRGRLAEQGPGASGAVTRSERSGQRTQRRAQRATQQCGSRDRTEVSRGHSSCGTSHEEGYSEGPNMKSKSCATGLMRGVEPDRVSRSWRCCMRLALHVCGSDIRARPCSPLHEPPGADPHAGWCGEGRPKAALTRLGGKAPQS